jgi:hypothetical protein
MTPMVFSALLLGLSGKKICGEFEEAVRTASRAHLPQAKLYQYALFNSVVEHEYLGISNSRKMHQCYVHISMPENAVAVHARYNGSLKLPQQAPFFLFQAPAASFLSLNASSRSPPSSLSNSALLSWYLHRS